MSDLPLDAEQLASARRPLERASTLPADAFTSPAVYAREGERILRREWLCGGRADQIPNIGDYRSLDLLGERLVIVRDKQSTIRVLSRICRHRAAELFAGDGNTRSFQCPYHAWTYELDGHLVGAPHMEGAEGFDRATCRLPEIRSELWEGWIFVNLDPDAQPLAPRLAPLSRTLANYRMAEMIATEPLVFDSPFNWKVLVDNFMEAYHHIAVHRNTLEPLFPCARSWTPDNEGPYSVLVMPAREETSKAPPGPSLPRGGRLEPEEEGRLVAAVAFPFHLFAPSAEFLTWYQILPETHERFVLRIHACFPRETLEDPAHRDAVEGIRGILEQIHREDIGACEAAWAGLQTPSFTFGRLSPLEKPIWQFNQWWIERMTDPPER